MKFYETDAFRRLQAEWYEKLKQDGFEDIEVGGPPGETMRLATDVRKDRDSVLATQGDEIAEYYQRAGRWLHDGKFETDQDWRIWELHSSGVSQKAIAKQLGISERRARQSTMDSREAMNQQPKGGRPTVNGARKEGVTIVARLTAEACAALDCIKAEYRINNSEAVRRALQAYAGTL